MRLWHKSLIPVLPRQQLISQWRELSAIATNLKTKGTPNHILVNPLLEYNLNHFITYATLVRKEMTKRGYRTMDSVWNKIVSVKPDWSPVDFDLLYSNWHNDTYLKICYYNLLEKYICGGISYEDYKKVSDFFAIQNNT